MSKTETQKSDWDAEDEDENWDDWGDAEDFTETPTASQKTPKEPTRSTTNSKNGNYNKPATEESAESQTATASSSSWGIWGVLSKATEGLGTITSSVSQGLNQVIGAPGPEELARLNAAETSKERIAGQQSEERTSAEQEEDTGHAFGLGLVTSLGSKVLNTGLDTLEGIGKKTMTLLQENDPMLLNKRKLLGLEPDQPNLSELLQEAKNDADKYENTMKELRLERCKEQLRFEVIFENECGLVHLEALEILSKECALKLQTLLDSVSGNALTELQETINEVRELMEMEELDCESEGDYDANALKENLAAAIVDADVTINFDDIVSNWLQSLQWFEESAAATADQEIFAKGINALAAASALEVNKLHKIAELLLVKEHHSTANEVDAIVQLCRQFNVHLTGQTNRYAALLTSKSSEEAKVLISTLFAEMLQATQHIEKAFKLFLPILQMGAV